MSSRRWIGLAMLASALLCPPARAITPTPGPPTDELVSKTVSGLVVDRFDGSGLAGVTVHYYDYDQLTGSARSGDAVTDGDGRFELEVELRGPDRVAIDASADGYVTERLDLSGGELWALPALDINLLPLRGSVEVTPHSGVSLGCEGDGLVTITNSQPDGGEDLTIVDLWPSNSYSQGDYGNGFTADLSAIELPITLAPGEHIAFPVHYSSAGQSFPSRLTVRMRSTAGESAGFAVPYRGQVAGCGTPTPTPTPGGSARCAGDCDGDGAVTIAELVREVAWGLGHRVATCGNADLDANGCIGIDELVAAVVAATEGCGARR